MTINPADCPYETAFRLADEMNKRILPLLDEQDDVQASDKGYPNVYLAALTLLWVEYVAEGFGSVGHESAVSVLRGIRTKKGHRKRIKMSVRDILRRSQLITMR